MHLHGMNTLKSVNQDSELPVSLFFIAILKTGLVSNSLSSIANKFLMFFHYSWFSGGKKRGFPFFGLFGNDYNYGYYNHCSWNEADDYFLCWNSSLQQDF